MNPPSDEEEEEEDEDDGQKVRSSFKMDGGERGERERGRVSR